MTPFACRFWVLIHCWLLDLVRAQTPTGTATSLVWADKDLDTGEVGGTISWTDDAADGTITHYDVYLDSSTAGGGGGVQVCADVASGVGSCSISCGTATASATYLVVYSKNAAGLQANTPASVSLNDAGASATAVNFLDVDLDVLQYGGSLSWAPPGAPDIIEVADYLLYVATSSAGAGRSQLGSGSIAVGTNSFVIPLETDQNLFGTYTHVLVYTQSSLCEQTTPAAGDLSDTASTVVSPTFQDLDLDSSEVGGDITWTAAGDTASVQNYVVYTAINAAGLSKVQLGSDLSSSATSTTVAANTAPTFSHIVIFTKSSAVEQTTPASIAVSDLSVTVSGLAFSDLDLDSGELGGSATWTVAVDESQLQDYQVYLAPNAAAASGGSRVLMCGNLAPGTATCSVPAETASASYLAIFASSSLVEQTTPAGVIAVTDESASCTSVSHLDLDLDAGDFGGDVTWSPPISEANVADYKLYLADSSDGTGARVLVGTETVVPSTATYTFPAAADNALVSGATTYFHILVYTRSSFVEQSTPAAATVSDASSSASAVTFQDLDLDSSELGGDIQWSPPSEVTYVIGYDVYLAATAAGGSKAAIGSQVAVGTNVQSMPEDTSPLGFVVVYSASSLTEQTTPAALQLTDAAATATSLSFIDEDLDASQVGGTFAWTEPADPTGSVAQYSIYLAPGAAPASRVAVTGGVVAVGQSSFTIPADTAPNSYLLLYTVSTSFEQTTPASLHISDMAASVSAVSFLDLDLDQTELGGDVSWTVPSDVSAVVNYKIFLATDSAGVSKSRIGSDALPSATSLAMSPDTPLSNMGTYTHAVVYTASTLAEQSTPSAVALSDVSASASGVLFADLDLDAAELGGIASWQPAVAAGLANVADYVLYLSTSSDGSSGSKSQVGSAVMAGTNELDLAGDIAAGSYSHLLVYARSSLVEQTTPAAESLSDTSSSASSVSFTDEDLDALDLGGSIGWSPPADVANVAGYMVYLASAAPGASRSQVGLLVAGTTTSLGAETPLGGHGFAVVYATSSLLEQTTPAAAALSDTSGIVSSLTFQDLDLDALQLGGDISWTPPTDAAQVLHYAAYLAEDASGLNAVQIGALVQVGTNTQAMSAEQSLGSFSHVVIYAKSSIAEQTTPASIAVSDSSASVSSVIFADLDLDQAELGGTIEWTSPVSVLVSYYNSYLSADSVGGSRVQVGGSVAFGTDEASLPANTAHSGSLPLAVVYTSSLLVEQTTPVAGSLSDASAPVSGVGFTDKDLDALEFGGTVSWTITGDTSLAASFTAYFAADAAGLSRSQVGTQVGVADRSLEVPTDAPQSGLGPYTHVVVYAMSSLFEQTTPGSVSLSDSSSTVASLQFPDKDLDALQLGGTITWSPAGDTVLVDYYFVNLANSASGGSKSQIGAPVAVGTTETSIPADSAKSSYTHVVVYTKSQLAEQTTPANIVLSDTSSLVSSLAFPDQDLDAGEVGGTISWSPASDLALVSYYLPFFATDGSGTGKSQLGSTQLAVGTNQIVLAAGTALASFTHVVVFSGSTLAEQTTPVSLAVSDTLGTPLSITFADLDLDPAEIGGLLTWLAPTGSTQVTGYDTYLAEDSAGVSRSQLGSTLSAATFSTSLVPETPLITGLKTFRYALVYGRSALEEQSTPGFNEFSDIARQISNLAFTDSDLDTGDIGGQASWDPPADPQYVAHYSVYFEGAGKDQLGSDLTVGSNALDVSAETSLGSHTFLAVYAKSTLVEQTTPLFLTITDTVATVLGVTFTDLDLDAAEVAGTVSWTPPGDVSLVLHYAVAFATDTSGLGRSELGSLQPVGTNQLDAPANTALAGSSHLVVYSRSALAEQTTPANLAISDSAPLVSNLQLPDEDLDAGELGGLLLWDPPASATEVSHYVVYLAQDTAGLGRSQLGFEVPVGTNHLDLNEDVAIGTFTHVVIYSRSSLALEPEQSTPVASALTDTSLSVASLSFTDEDLDAGQLRGSGAWPAPVVQGTSASHTGYALYLATDATGSGRSLVDGAISSTALAAAIAADTSLGSFTHLLLYGVSPSSEQNVPAVTFAISDTAASVSGLAFADEDLDALELGGAVEWVEPTDSSSVNYYVAYLAPAATEVGRSKIGSDVVVGTTTVSVSAETALGSFARILVYTKSALVEQTTPVALSVTDQDGLVTGVAFADADLDSVELAGEVTWTPAAGATSATSFNVYLAQGAGAGATRQQLTASPVAVGTNSILVPADTAMASWSHVVVHARSSLAEQTTPAAISLIDEAVQVQSLSFQDLDLDIGEVGGTVQWAAPAIAPSTLVGYNAYLASDAAGTGRSQIGSLVAVGTNEAVMSADTSLGGGTLTHILVYASSSLLEQTFPSFASVTDVDSTIIGVGFTDRDLDALQMGGTVTWNEPTDHAVVDSYDVYTATDASGTGLVAIGATVPVGTNAVDILANTAVASFSHILVYARSSLAEQTTPGLVSISDTSSSVLAVNFADQDLDTLEVGGLIDWTPPTDFAQVASYKAYLADSSDGSGVNSLVGTAVVVGSNQASLLQDTAKSGNTHVIVFSVSSLEEQTTPVAVALVDEVVSVTGVTFEDNDLDQGQLGGSITWTPPGSPGQATHYVVYLAGGGASRSQVGAAVPVGTNVATLAVGTSIGSFTEVWVYTQSALFESSTPTTLLVVDYASSVSSVAFQDKDLDAAQFGGDLSWSEAADTSRALDYFTYWATDYQGSGKVALASSLAIGTTTATVAANAAQGTYTHLVVYSRSSLEEQTTPAFVSLVDVDASVSGIVFQDKDLDQLQVGGTVSWSPPTVISQVVDYLVYLAQDSAGTGRVLVGSAVTIGTNAQSLLAETAKASFARLLIYTRSSLTEQSTPSNLLLVDVHDSVIVTATDRDLDGGELGGVIAWSLPTHVALVTTYSVYLADDTAGTNRNLLGSAVSVGTNQLVIAQNTAIGGQTYVNVFLASSLAEQTTPRSTLSLSDTSSSVSAVSFQDLDLDSGEVGGDIVWSAPADTSEVLHYLTYLANDAAGTGRVAKGTVSVLAPLVVSVASNTALLALSHALVYSKSSLAEQTTPVAAAVTDNIVTLLGLSLTDLDLDPQELGGDVQWTSSGDTSLVSLFLVYIANSALGVSRVRLGPDGNPVANSISVPADTGISSQTHLLVYAQSSLAEQSTPAVAALSETVIGYAALSFTDEDLDAGEVGGTVSWSPTGDTAQVQNYFTYLAQSATGGSRSLVGSVSTPGQTCAAETVPPAVTPHVVVYAQSSLAEQTTPQALALSDSVSSVLLPSFTDDDLDAAEVGGTITWQAPATDFSLVSAFEVYLAQDSAGGSRSNVGNGATNQFSLPEDTSQLSFSYILVYTRSALVEQSTPVDANLVDVATGPENMVFTDLDLDLGQLGGDISWTTPATGVGHIVAYGAYLAQDANGLGRSLIAAEVLVSTTAQTLPVETAIASWSHIVVYARSALFEQTTPTSVLLLSDTISSVSGVTFVDTDLDLLELGGTVSWSPAADSTNVQSYIAYLAKAADFVPRERIDVETAIGTNLAPMPCDIALVDYERIAVYTKSSLAEQTTPEVIAAVDNEATVASILQEDKDLDASQIGGDISWAPAADSTHVVSYALYLYANATNQRSSLGADLILGTNKLAVFELDTPSPVPTWDSIAVYTRSASCEQTTPLAILLTDSSSSVSAVVFADEDLDATEFGGIVSWTPPADVSQVAHYVVYSATDSKGHAKVQLETAVPVGTDLLSLSANKVKGSYTHLVVYTRSSFSEQSTPTALGLVDHSASVSGVTLTDRDLDAGEVGGSLGWLLPGDITYVAEYLIYLASAVDGTGRSQLGSTPNLTDVSLDFAADVAVVSTHYALVYTKSSFVEQTTPASALASDLSASVSSLTFGDKDLDAGEFGGSVSWAAPSDRSRVVSYYVYAATDGTGTSREVLPGGGGIAVGGITGNLQFPADVTVPASKPSLLVYTHSSLAEQSTPVEILFSDASVAVASLTLADEDLDGGEIAGAVTWTASGDTALSTHYVVYLTAAGGLTDGSSRSHVGEVVGSAAQLQVAGNTVPPPAPAPVEIAIYAKSVLAEQSAPAMQAFLTDVAGSVSSVSFEDDDLDQTKLGGTVAWSPPGALSQVLHYAVYLASSAAGGAARTQLGLVAVGTNEFSMPKGTSRGIYAYVVVYTKSASIEQSTPDAMANSDTFASVSLPVLLDLDLDAQQLGNEVSWTAPLSTSRVVVYNVYLAQDAAGRGRLALGGGAFVPVGVNKLDIAADTPLASCSHVVVYCASALFEETTPAATAISDASASASSVVFADGDLDSLELGGTISWTAPVIISEVAHYSAYLAESSSGTNRSQVGADVSSTQVSIAAESPLDSYTHIVVYTKSTLAEQTTPAAVTLSDAAASATSLSFTDLDLDSGELGGTMTWAVAGDTGSATGYDAYLASDGLGSGRSQLGSTLASSARSVAVAAETPAVSHAVVYARSSVVEQTTPTALALTDASDVVVLSSLSFEDQDPDSGELGGILSWLPPAIPSTAFTYRVYLSDSSTGTNRALLGLAQLQGINQISVPANTLVGFYTHWLVYTKSPLVEQTTPAAVALVDAGESASSLAFLDDDLDASHLGGTISWLPPASLSIATHYALYLSTSSAGGTRSAIGAPLAAGGSNSANQQSLNLPADTPTSSFTHVLVYLKSATLEQTTPAAVAIVDAVASVSSLTFHDLDLDTAEVGGSLSWSLPAVLPQLQSLHVYLSPSSGGADPNKLLLEELNSTATEATLPDNTASASFGYLLVFTKSTLARQTTPVALAISDTVAGVAGVALVDDDLDASQVGGTVSWQVTGDALDVDGFNVYLATLNAATRSQVGGTVPSGTNVLQMLDNTPVPPYTHVAVYTFSSFSEKSTPTA
ncbi:unnamed protein product, partial [Polarella glacialis]